MLTNILWALILINVIILLLLFYEILPIGSILKYLNIGMAFVLFSCYYSKYENKHGGCGCSDKRGGCGCIDKRGGKGELKNKRIDFNDDQYRVITLSKNSFPLLYNGLREMKNIEDIHEFKYTKEDKYDSVSLFTTPDIYMAKKYSLKFIRVYKLLKDIDLILIENNNQLDAEELNKLREENNSISGAFINWSKQNEDTIDDKLSLSNYKLLTNKKDIEYIDIDLNIKLNDIGKYLKLVAVHEIVDDEISETNLINQVI